MCNYIHNKTKNVGKVVNMCFFKWSMCFLRVGRGEAYDGMISFTFIRPFVNMVLLELLVHQIQFIATRRRSRAMSETYNS